MWTRTWPQNHKHQHKGKSRTWPQNHKDSVKTRAFTLKLWSCKSVRAAGKQTKNRFQSERDQEDQDQGLMYKRCRFYVHFPPDDVRQHAKFLLDNFNPKNLVCLFTWGPERTGSSPGSEDQIQDWIELLGPAGLCSEPETSWRTQRTSAELLMFLTSVSWSSNHRQTGNMNVALSK